MGWGDQLKGYCSIQAGKDGGLLEVVVAIEKSRYSKVEKQSALG